MELLNKIELLNKLKDKYNDNWPSEIAEGFQTAVDMIDEQPTVEALPIEWLCDYAVIIADNNYEQAKFIFRLIENYNSELNEDKDKVAIDNLMRLKENWKRNNETCGQ